jgi:hypothetical protein
MCHLDKSEQKSLRRKIDSTLDQLNYESNTMSEAYQKYVDQFEIMQVELNEGMKVSKLENFNSFYQEFTDDYKYN